MLQLPIEGITVYDGHALVEGDIVMFAAPKYPWWIHWYAAIMNWNPCNGLVEPIPGPAYYRAVEVWSTHVVLEEYE